MNDGLIPPVGALIRAAFLGCNRVISKCRTPNDHLGYTSPPERALLVVEGREASIFNRTRAPKPRRDASCRRLSGTGVVISQFCERSPRGTGQHPVVLMPFTHKVHCGW
jgi:hypothetical protein